MVALAGEQNPFLRYREQLQSYQVATDVGSSRPLSDGEFVELVTRLDERVAKVWGTGFVVTPLVDGAALAAAAGISSRLSIKVEANSVGGSHKARHLFGVAVAQLVAEKQGAAVAQLVAEKQGAAVADRLAIASCGNAALGAAVIARAMERPLDVFVPLWADETVVAQLDELGATINRCERRDGEAGDPCYLRFREAVDDGATAFSVQGTDTATTFDGARTLAWEITEQVNVAELPAVDALYIQVGGGALATSVAMEMPHTRIHPVQAEGCAPLRRAWERWTPFDDLHAAVDAAQQPDQTFMTPWENPNSFATGILDDITYDWVPLLTLTHQRGGAPVVADESTIKRAYELAHANTDINVCSTGTAGFAGVLTEPPSSDEHVVVLFTGIDRT